MSGATSTNPPARLVSLDAYRGLVMLAMVSGGLGFSAMAARFPESRVWAFLGYEFSHAEWTGCSFWDLIQPSFMFIVGVAMPYSFARRLTSGDSRAKRAWHVLYRSAVLVLLGIFLRSDGRSETYFTFEDVLTQIGLGYPLVYLLLGRRLVVQGLAAAAILVGYSLLFVQYPLPGRDFDYAAVGVPSDWPHFSGIAAHFDKNTNVAAAFDVWFLNLFPRSSPFTHNGGGYQTLSFVPSMATMLFGVMAGTLMRREIEPGAKIKQLVIAGAACFAAAMAVDGTIWPFVDWRWTYFPVVKRIWTPTWAVFSAGWTLWLLAVMYWIIDVKGYRRWAFPLVVVGMNSIAMYVMAKFFKGWAIATLKTHLGQDIFAGTYGPVLAAFAGMFVLWLFCYWLYRRRIFLRI
jgi:predicted acyltransferase